VSERSFSSWLLVAAAAVEGVTGVALIAAPQMVAGLLFGTDLALAGIAAARVAGSAILSLALMCWLARRSPSGPILAAILTYNFLVAIYLVYIGIGGELIGILLWPAVVLHALMTLLLGRLYMWSDGRAA
jgi:hypothetical protein